MFIDPLLRKLPPSTNAWTCKWFALICYLSVVLAALGVTVIPGAAGIVAISLGTVVLLTVIAMRDSADHCPR